MFQTVLIATDGSASAERAVTAAADLAFRFDAAVHALYVREADEREDAAGVGDAETADEAALAVVREAAATAGVDRVTTAVHEGEPATEICDYAREVEADVIATGTRGRHGEHSFLLGSVAEAVVRESPIPVLTVRQRAASAPSSE